MVDSIASAGLRGIQSGINTANQAASDIARTATTTDPVQAAELPELAESAVNLLRAEQQVQASARVVETADEVLGTIIDIRA